MDKILTTNRHEQTRTITNTGISNTFCGYSETLIRGLSSVSVRVCSCLFVIFVDYVLSFDYLRHIS